MNTSAKAVGALLRDWIQRSYKAGESYAAIARRLGVSKATITNVRDGGRDVGPDVEAKAAALLYGGSIDELRRVAHERYEAQRAREEQHPNRAEAVDICRRSKRISEEAIESFLADPLPDKDLPTLEYIDVIRLRDQQLARLKDEQETKPQKQAPRRPPRR